MRTACGRLIQTSSMIGYHDHVSRSRALRSFCRQCSIFFVCFSRSLVISRRNIRPLLNVVAMLSDYLDNKEQFKPLFFLVSCEPVVDKEAISFSARRQMSFVSCPEIKQKRPYSQRASHPLPGCQSAYKY